ncbi:unnamed protein product, partial [Polarella glacialis]
DTTDVCLDDGDVCSDDDSNSQDKNDNDNSNNSEAAEKPETLQIRSRPRKGSKERAVRSFKFDSQGSKEPQLRESTECEVQTEIETTECEVQTEMDASVIEKAEEMLQKRAENSWLELMGKVGEELSEDQGNEVQMSDLPNSAALAISESPHGDLSTGQGSSTPTESSSLTLVLPDGIAEEKQLQSPAWLPSNLQSAGNASPRGSPSNKAPSRVAASAPVANSRTSASVSVQVDPTMLEEEANKQEAAYKAAIAEALALQNAGQSAV